MLAMLCMQATKRASEGSEFFSQFNTKLMSMLAPNVSTAAKKLPPVKFDLMTTGLRV